MQLGHVLFTLASLAVIVFAYNRYDGHSVGAGFKSAALGLVAFAAASAYFGWAGEDASRLMALLVVMVGAATFLAIRIARHGRSRRHVPGEPHDQREVW